MRRLRYVLASEGVMTRAVVTAFVWSAALTVWACVAVYAMIGGWLG